jgi:tetratricopeptide (TPR) repeat protein
MNHNHTNCGCNSHIKDPTGITRKRIFSLSFVLVLTLLIKPFMADQLIKRADAYYAFDLYDDAIRQYKKGILLGDVSSGTWINLGDCFKEKSELSKAIAAFREAVKVAPEDRAANFYLGMALAKGEDYNSAIVYFEKVRSFGAESKEQLALYGVSYYRSSLMMLAICFEKLRQFERAATIREELERLRCGEP